MATPRIGFIELGRMGGPMSLRLINAGFDLVVFDTNPEAPAPRKDAGAERCAPRLRRSSIRLISRSSAFRRPTLLKRWSSAASSRARESKTIVDLSTSGPGMAMRVSKRP